MSAHSQPVVHGQNRNAKLIRSVLETVAEADGSFQVKEAQSALSKAGLSPNTSSVFSWSDTTAVRGVRSLRQNRRLRAADAAEKKLSNPLAKSRLFKGDTVFDANPDGPLFRTAEQANDPGLPSRKEEFETYLPLIAEEIADEAGLFTRRALVKAFADKGFPPSSAYSFLRRTDLVKKVGQLLKLADSGTAQPKAASNGHDLGELKESDILQDRIEDALSSSDVRSAIASAVRSAILSEVRRQLGQD